MAQNLNKPQVAKPDPDLPRGKAQKWALVSAVAAAGSGIWAGNTGPIHRAEPKPTSRDKYTEEQQRRKLTRAQAKRERKKAKQRKVMNNEQ